MRSRAVPPDECVRACEWTSLRVDSQLSEFEEVLLTAHLKRCPDCSAFAATVTGLTETLRTAPLEQPTFAFQLPRRRGARAIGLRAVSAAAAIALVGLSSFASLHLFASRSPIASRTAREVIGLKEQQMQGLDSAGRTGSRLIAPGLEAAEDATVSPIPAPTVRSFRTATRTPTEGR